MKTQKAQGITLPSPPCRRKSCFTLRGRNKDGVIQGKLRIRSFPGVFLVLGVIVVVVGTALAVAGYWPYQIPRVSILGAADKESLSESQTSGWGLGAKGVLSTASLIHSERMKLLGPVIMGVGLFILICANTVLYENRDKETQMLLAQMHSVICSVSAAVPSADLKEIAAVNSMAKHYQWVSSLPAAHLNILCMQKLASSEPLLQTSPPRDQKHSVESIYQQAVLQTEVLHHSPHSSFSKSSNSSQTDFNTQSDAEYGGIASFLPPLVKLNNCLVSASLSTLDEVDMADIQLRRCHSMSYRTNPYSTGTGVQDVTHAPGEEGEINQLVVTREAASQVCVNISWQFVEVAEKQTCRSWPRLDLVSSRRYLKLENKEDSVDKLLDQIEQQCYQWDNNFGSGPFQ